jgi:hypothetical protein
VELLAQSEQYSKTFVSIIRSYNSSVSLLDDDHLGMQSRKVSEVAEWRMVCRLPSGQLEGSLRCGETIRTRQTTPSDGKSNLWAEQRRTQRKRPRLLRVMGRYRGTALPRSLLTITLRPGLPSGNGPNGLLRK